MARWNGSLGKEQTLEDIATYYLDVQAGLYAYFSGSSPALYQRHGSEEIGEAREKALEELDMTSSLSVLSSTEAAIRLDYIRRVSNKLKDPLSKEMRALYRKVKNRARLEDDLISLWQDNTEVSTGLLGELKGAFRYRHWLAHGRYWEPKLGRRYDYQSVFELAQEFYDTIEEHR